MKMILEFILILLGVMMIMLSFVYNNQSKKTSYKEKELEFKTKSILLFVYGCLYEVIILLLFRYFLFESGVYLPCFLVTFVLGKVSYNLLYRHLTKGCA